MPYWYVRMRQGSGGWNFTRDVWETDAVGIMFGAWAAEDVMTADGGIDLPRLTLDWLRRDCAHPTAWLTSRLFSQIRTFLVEVSPGDPVIVYYDAAIHVGTIGPGLHTFAGV